jgi:uncharacterized protein (DUF1499 family)
MNQETFSMNTSGSNPSSPSAPIEQENSSQSLPPGKMTTLRLALTILALFALLTGVGIGLIALMASLGVWLNLWDFRRGFELLRTANDYGDKIAIGCAIAAVAIFLISNRFRIRNGNLLGVLALIGMISATLAYYIPESYRPGEGVNIPPIHDITTDTDNPPQFVDVLALRGPGTNTVIYGTSPNMTPERLASLQRAAYPDIQPVVINAPRDEVFDRALATVNRLGWELVAQSPAEGRIEATDTTFWFRFKDDVVIIVSESPEGTVVNARSVSRVGVSDVGKNAERLRKFFAEL